MAERKKRAAGAARGSGRGLVPAELVRARATWRRGDFDLALREFEVAVRAAPGSIPVLVDAARAYADRHRLDRVRQLLERALKLGWRDPQAHFVVGETYRVAGLIDDAESCFRHTLRLADRAPQALVELAHLRERRGDLDEALQLIARLLQQHPGHAPALVLKGRVLRRQGNLTEAEGLLRNVADSAGLPPELRAEAMGDLAELLDEDGRCPEAWEAIERCKALQGPSATAALAAADFVRERFARMAANVSPAHFATWDAEPAGDVEPHAAPRLALLTGFPRSGTTLIERALDAHPAIVACEERDILATATMQALHGGASLGVELLDVLSAPRETIDKARRVYTTTLAAAVGPTPEGSLLLDKNPALTPMAPVYLRLFPQAKVVFVLRDPRDVLLSCYLRWLPLNPVSANFLTLERAAEKLASDLTGWLRLREMIPGRFAEIRYEEAIDDFEGEMRRLVAFLGLEWSESVLGYRSQGRAVLSPSYAAVAKPLYTGARGRWRRYERELAPSIERLGSLVESLGYA
ncbi:MAG: tetratricopeptide repeat-containing sulfotransferase family protein [Lacipirellulaceae bacterium]